MRPGGRWLLALALVALLAPAAAATPDPLAVGRAKARDERCTECHLTEPHDPERLGTSSERFPKLVGQVPAYLVKQLQDFRSGARRHEIMTVMARDLGDEDMVRIASYFASLPTMHGGQPSVNARPAPALYSLGDAARGIAACASCHGAAGKQPLAGAMPIPLIGGQERPYIEYQLRDWRNGDRRNSPGDLMNQQTHALTEDEIAELAQYLSAQ
jgi:cytochrome c553